MEYIFLGCVSAHLDVLKDTYTLHAFAHSSTSTHSQTYSASTCSGSLSHGHLLAPVLHDHEEPHELDT